MRCVSNSVEIDGSMTIVSVSNILAGKDIHAFPASFAQQRLWLLDQSQASSTAYNLFYTVRISVPLDVEALERSLHALVQRHETLRTTFIVRDEQPMQMIAPALIVPLARVDLQPLPEAKREAEALRLANEQAQQLFDLARGPLL